VLIAEANENLGYAGAINAWLRILMTVRDWPGVWILNPDTEPASQALFELVAWSRLRRRGMVGSRIVPSSRPDLIHSRGLRWRRFHSSTEAVDYLAPAAVEPDHNSIERRIDSPSGASVYVTRDCLNKIGLMDERYFLYFEDLDWGYQAKRFCGIGYAFNSVVAHHVGTTIGTGSKDSAASALSVYLDFRNRIHFIRKHHRGWLVWSLMVLALQALRHGLRGALTNMRAAFAGILAGITGEIGRPSHII
jgi:N-acetylglucosaminyl-diphospho-decaprenol L-rhamnosyltransferase